MTNSLAPTDAWKKEKISLQEVRSGVWIRQIQQVFAQLEPVLQLLSSQP